MTGMLVNMLTTAKMARIREMMKTGKVGGVRRLRMGHQLLVIG